MPKTSKIEAEKKPFDPNLSSLAYMQSLDPQEYQVQGYEKIFKHNSLISAAYELSLTEMRIIALAIVIMRRDQTKVEFSPLEPVTIHANTYANFFKTTKQNAYGVLAEAAQSLRKRTISWIDDYQGATKVSKRLNDLSWTTMCSYVEGEALIQVYFSPQIIPFLQYLEGNYSTYEIRNLGNLNNPYEFRMYELAVAWKNKGVFQMKKENLRQALGIFDDKQFATTSNFGRLLKTTVKTIARETDLIIDFEAQYITNPNSKGRILSGYQFTVKQKVSISQEAAESLEGGNGHLPIDEADLPPPIPPQNINQAPTEEERLDSLGATGTSLRYDDTEAEPEDAEFKEISEVKKAIRGDGNTLSALPDENGNWDIDFILSKLHLPGFYIYNMKEIPNDLIIRHPEYDRWKTLVGHDMAKNMIEQKLQHRIVHKKSETPGHTLSFLPHLDREELVKNAGFLSKYAPIGMTDPAQVKQNLLQRLAGDLSLFPDLLDYLPNYR